MPLRGALDPKPAKPAKPAVGLLGRRGACSAGPGPLLAPPPAPTSRVRASGPALALEQAPGVFVMRVLLEETGEMFQATNCRGDMTVRELKEELELLVGVPLDLQRLHYLDQGVLMDETTLKSHDVVPGGIISLCVWHYDGWTELVLAAVEGDPSERWKAWVSQRAFVALYITSHRGHPDAMQYLLEHGANCLRRTPMGRTALHVAAATGRLDSINLLLNYGASIHDKDARGETPVSIARRMNHRHSERQMFLFYWMTRSGTADPKKLTANKLPHWAKSGFGSKKKSHSSLALGARARRS